MQSNGCGGEEAWFWPVTVDGSRMNSSDIDFRKGYRLSLDFGRLEVYASDRPNFHLPELFGCRGY
jgi:hypothetical protein